MSAVKDYANEYITTLQGEMPISVALLVLKYRYEDDIVASLYDYAFVNQDKYVAQQANAAFSRDRQRNAGSPVGPIASPGNLPRTPVSTMTEMMPVETFVDRVKAIIRKAATLLPCGHFPALPGDGRDGEQLCRQLNTTAGWLA